MSDIDLDALQEAWAVLDAAVDDAPGRSNDALITFSRAIDYLTVLKASIAASSVALVQRAETAERERDELKAWRKSLQAVAPDAGLLIEKLESSLAEIKQRADELAANRSEIEAYLPKIAAMELNAKRYAAIKKMLPDLLAVAAQGGVNTDEAPDIFANHIDSSKLDAGVDAWIAQQADVETRGAQ